MKALLIILFFAFAELLQATAQQSHKKDGGRVALDKVSSLPEVRDFLREYQNRKAIAILNGSPDKDSKYYSVKVGISDMGMLSTNFNFYIHPKTYEIFYADYFTDQGEQILTLTQWRRFRKLPVWQKWHCYNYKGKNLIIYPCEP
ncbi:hypothetical protein IDJ75_20555 [Mucilaginibacter rigui]|uniref:Uncharacterized protein n=1 Tax=Mucilaginibacter rigui TaxID=534635 RepID=A0ABR7XAR5_9SPHI|nr:hypothetical protein [Mucilaginibacter rigui]MBD1387687.1 hypothetical protein [Mucilaginibacter rigui]